MSPAIQILHFIISENSSSGCDMTISKNFLYHFSKYFNHIKLNHRYQTRFHTYLPRLPCLFKVTAAPRNLFSTGFYLFCQQNKSRGHRKTKKRKERNIDCEWQCWFAFHRSLLHSPFTFGIAPARGQQPWQDLECVEWALKQGAEYHKNITYMIRKAQGIRAPHIMQRKKMARMNWT